jgi:hypothetical protein
MNCCSRKSVSASQPRLASSRPNEVVIENFEKLVESLQIDLLSTDELRVKKNAFISRTEWTVSGRNRMTNLNEDFKRISDLLTDQIDHLARGLKAELIINTRIEDTLSKELRSNR